ncbi:MAG: aldehyde dehydrogenase [Verrucomicrobiae bacterium]|nr:aldehyde dehydrogenase [Verrucomicrobiae bacterium]
MDFTNLVRRQRAFFHSSATRPAEFRIGQLRQLHDALVAHEPALLAALHADLHKSAYEAYATELGFVLHEVRHALRHCRSWMKPRRRRAPPIAWPGRGFIRSEPYGVALVIGPWNYPLQLLLSPLVGAMAAGNCAILKPSEFAPHTAAAVAKLVAETFAEEYLAVVLGEREAAEALLLEKFDTIFFTGSTNVGRAVMTAAARHLTPVTLELGGKCPCLVCADAPIEVAARRIAWGKFMNAGQTCVAPDFLLVDRRIRKELLASVKQAIGEFYGADPATSPDYGRIINRRHFDRLTSYLDNGQIAHGGQHDAESLYLAPTILTDVPMDAPVMAEEIFGPVLPVVEFSRLEEALALLRDRPTPLALYLFTRNRTTQEQVLEQTRSGGVGLNDVVTHMIGNDLPFGGLGDSGFGAYHGQASFECFSHRRSVLRAALGFDPRLRYPPPRVKLATLKRAFHFLLGR